YVICNTPILKMLNLNFQKTSHNRLLMFLNIKEMSRALCFDNSVTNNALFGRQVHYFIEIIEK
ncbi:hypothetical protein ACFWD4_26745, partial [Bacillus cereus]